MLLLPGTDSLLPKSTSQKASHTQFNLPTSTRGDKGSPWSTSVLSKGNYYYYSWVCLSSSRIFRVERFSSAPSILDVTLGIFDFIEYGISRGAFLIFRESHLFLQLLYQLEFPTRGFYLKVGFHSSTRKEENLKKKSIIPCPPESLGPIIYSL